MTTNTRRGEPVAKGTSFTNWSISPHIGRQGMDKGINLQLVADLITGKIEAWLERRNHDKCRVCGAPKVYLYCKDKPENEVDPKLVGCETCAKFFTVYLHERSHGNTPIHPYQAAKGMTHYFLPACEHCGYKGKVTLEDKTQEQVNAKFIHFCTPNRRKRRK